MAVSKDRTTVWIPKDLKEELDSKKQSSHEPTYEVIKRLLKGV